MSKVLSTLFLSIALLSTCAYCAQNNNSYNDAKNYDNYNFEDNSFYISDEQFKDAQNIKPIEEKQSFTTQVINSGHFTSNTATRTWMPFNKNKD